MSSTKLSKAIKDAIKENLSSETNDALTEFIKQAEADKAELKRTSRALELSEREIKEIHSLRGRQRAELESLTKDIDGLKEKLADEADFLKRENKLEVELANMRADCAHASSNNLHSLVEKIFVTTRTVTTTSTKPIVNRDGYVQGSAVSDETTTERVE